MINRDDIEAFEDMDRDATRAMKKPSRLYYVHGDVGNYVTGVRPTNGDEVLQVFEEIEDDGN